MQPFLHFFPFVLIFLVIDGYFEGGLWNFQAVVFSFSGLILLDVLFGTSTANRDRSQWSAGGLAWLWKLSLHVWPVAQTVVLVWGLAVIQSGSLSVLEAIGFTLSVGVMGSVGIIAAHELTHRRGRWERAVAELLMAQVSYTHFCIEHVYGHHVNVATPRDPASAPAGMGFYRFLARSLPGGLASAWRIECQRLDRKSLPIWGWHNKMLRYGLELVVIYGAVSLFAGWAGLAFFIGQGAVAFIMFESVNYIEHYGMERREVRPGRYEPIRPRHSWNSNHRMTNLFLFNLGRHPDHHLDANRRYESLRHIDDAPQLPAGYAAMILLSFVPPLWHAVMDRRAAEWRQRALSEVAA